MTELFDQCGWDGPGFMQLSREVREITPLLHERDLYLQNGALTAVLDDPAHRFVRDFICAQHYRENEITP